MAHYKTGRSSSSSTGPGCLLNGLLLLYQQSEIDGSKCHPNKQWSNQRKFNRRRALLLSACAEAPS
jgi:hypothetical protein